MINLQLKYEQVFPLPYIASIRAAFAINTLFFYPENMSLVSKGRSMSWFMVVLDGGKVELIAQINYSCKLINLWYEQI